MIHASSNVKQIIESIPKHVHLSPSAQNLMIQVLASRKHATLAWKFFKKCMDQNEISILTPMTFSTVLRALLCASMIKELQESMPYIAQLQTTNFELANIFVALIDGYSSMDRFDQCVAVFKSIDPMVVHNEVLQSLTNAFVQNEVKMFYTRESSQFSSVEYSSIETILALMNSKSSTLPIAILMTILQMFERLPYTNGNRETFTRLLKEYVLPLKTHDPSVMMQVYNIYALWPHDCLEEMLEWDSDPNWNSIVSTLLNNHRLAHINTVLAHMERNHLGMKYPMLSMIVSFFANSPRYVSTTLRLLEEFRTKYGFFCTTALFNSLLRSYIETARSMKEVDQFVNDFTAQHEIETDWTTSYLMLSAHIKLSSADDVAQYMRRIKGEGFMLTSQSANPLLQLLCDQDQDQLIQLLLHQLESIDHMTRTIIMGHYSRKKQAHIAKQLLSEHYR